MSDTEHLLQHAWNRTPAEIRAGHVSANQALRQENAHLKDLVVTLSAIIAKNAAREK